MELRGETSGATATISAKRLISDLGANLIGSFYINFRINYRNH